MDLNSKAEQAWLPDLLYAHGCFEPDLALVCDHSGHVVRLAARNEVDNPIRLQNRALLPGLVNAHSHAFQRVIRGRTEYRTNNTTDSFWTWRELMYRAANQLSPEDVYVASRMAFLEMALSGITAVGEFHYIHHSTGGAPYEDPNLLAKEVVRAARDVGVRIALLRVAYARAGFETDPNPQQIRFIEDSADRYLKNLDQLQSFLTKTYGTTEADGIAWAGIAPHSVRAVPLDYLKALVAFGNERQLPVHMHLAEQPAEVSACIKEYGRSPLLCSIRKAFSVSASRPSTLSMLRRKRLPRSAGRARPFVLVPRPSEILATALYRLMLISRPVCLSPWELTVTRRLICWKTRASWNITSDCSELSEMFWPRLRTRAVPH